MGKMRVRKPMYSPFFRGGPGRHGTLPSLTGQSTGKHETQDVIAPSLSTRTEYWERRVPARKCDGAYA